MKRTSTEIYTMTDLDPIAKLAMTPRSQKEAGIHYLEWADESLTKAASVVGLIFGFMILVTLLVVSI